MVKLGKYQICLLDLITDHKGKLAASKIWNHIGFIALTYVLILRAEVTAEVIFAFGAVVAGNHIAIYWLKQKYNHGGGDANRDDSEISVDDNPDSGAVSRVGTWIQNRKRHGRKGKGSGNRPKPRKQSTRKRGGVR